MLEVIKNILKLVPAVKIRRVLLLIISAIIIQPCAYADDDPLIAIVADPYLEMHSGPGRGYPIFHVIYFLQVMNVYTLYS